MNLKIIELKDEIKNFISFASFHRPLEEQIKNHKKNYAKLEEAIIKDAVVLGIGDYLTFNNEYGNNLDGNFVDGVYKKLSSHYQFDECAKINNGKYFFEKDYFELHKDNYPEYLTNRNYICVECLGKPISFSGSRCPHYGCKEKANNFYKISINIGMAVYEKLHDINKFSNNLYVDENEHFNELYDEIVKALPIYSTIDECKKPKMYRLSDRYVIIDKERCKKLINYYVNEYNKKSQNDLLILKKIKFKNLFWRYSYEINFNSDLSIVYGPNGMGKTTIFNYLRAILIKPDSEWEMKKNGNLISMPPFEELEIEFDDGKWVRLSNSGEGLVKFDYCQNETDEIKPVKLDQKCPGLFINQHYESIKKLLPQLTFTKNKFLYVETESSKNINAFFALKSELLTYVKRLNKDKQDLTVKAFKSKINKLSSELLSMTFVKELNDRLTDIVQRYNKEYKNAIKQLRDEKIISFDKFTNEDFFEIYKHSFEYGDEPRDYEDFIIPDTPPKDGQPYQYVEYVNRMEEPKQIFLEELDFFNKLAAFSKHFNSLFSKNDSSAKKIDYRGGTFCVKAKRDSNDKDYTKQLQFNQLSSGEQNIVTILYNLIFNTGDGSIILIDEPEISLHVFWQKKLMDIIAEIMNENEYGNRIPIQVIIASHSPYICEGYSDYMVAPQLRENNDD